MKPIITKDTEQLPHCIFAYNVLEKRHCLSNSEVTIDNLSIKVKDYHPQPYFFKNERSFVCILGQPILGDKIDRKGIAESLSLLKNDRGFMRSLNGEFLIVYLDRADKSLYIINDRFCSIPLYYTSNTDKFLGSVFYNDLWINLREEGKLRLNEDAFFEFLWLQRLLGTKTYDTLSRFLPAASCLKYSSRQLTVESYWTPSFEKSKEPLEQCSVRLAHYLKESINRKTSDGEKRYGLFLSGGTDSRTILAAFAKPLICFTMAVSKNNEYRIAHEAAIAKNARHVFMQLEPDSYSNHLGALVKLTGGMYAFDHALFYGFRHIVKPLVDVVFHGHAIDYFFQGIYLPKEVVEILSLKTQMFRLRKTSEDFITDYLYNIQHRLKYIDLLSFVKQGYRDKVYSALREAVREVMEAGRGFCNTPYDFWEYMLIHALSRHYSNPNLASMAISVEQRTVAFDNDIFDLYLSLPVDYRLNGKIARLTLKFLNRRMARIRRSNTNMRGDLPPVQVEFLRIWDLLLRKAHLRKKTVFWTPAEERTWPDRGRLIAIQPKMRQEALGLCKSEPLASLNFLDMDTLAKQVPRWLEKPDKGSGAFMTYLITLHHFLRQ